MELQKNLLGQKAFNTKPKFQEFVLIVMDKHIHQKHLAQPIQTKNKQFKIAVTFLTGYNGIINFTISNNKFNFAESNFDKNGFFQLINPRGA